MILRENLSKEKNATKLLVLMNYGVGAQGYISPCHVQWVTFLTILLFIMFIIYQWRGDLAYEISSLEVYPPIS